MVFYKGKSVVEAPQAKNFWGILLKILKILAQNPINPPLVKSQISDKGGVYGSKYP